MDATVSVSKGCFVFNPSTRKRRKTTHDVEDFENELWYKSYKTRLDSVEKKLKQVYEDIYSDVLKDLVSYVQHSHDDVPHVSAKQNIIPVAALLTGVNMPDHAVLFDRMSSLLHEHVTPHVATLHAQDCTTIKASVEQIVSQLMNKATNTTGDESGSEDEGVETVVKKQQCNFIALEAWYTEMLSESRTSALPSSPKKRGTESPSSPKKRSAELPSSPKKRSAELPSSPKKRSAELPSSPKKRSTELPSSPKKRSAELPSSPKKRGAESPSSPKKRGAESPSSPKKRGAESPSSPKKRGAESPSKRKRSSDGKQSPNKRGTSSSASNPPKTDRPLLVIVIPEFEGFNSKVLQSLLTVASFQATRIPMTFVFGVATSVQALQRGLTFKVSSKLSIQVFHSQRSITFLDNVLEKVLINEMSPFHLGGKTFKLFCEVFLFYDFSVQGFIQHLKFCLMEHFYGRGINSLCCDLEDLEGNVAALTKADLEDLKDLPSFQRYLYTCPVETEDQLSNDYEKLKTGVTELVKQLHRHTNTFFLMLRVVNILCCSLPNAPLGHQMRKLYEISVSGSLCDTKEFKECFKLIGFQSRDELLEKVTGVIATLRQAGDPTLDETVSDLEGCRERLERVGLAVAASPTKTTPRSPRKNVDLLTDSAGKKCGRTQFLQNVLVSGKKEHPLSAYETERKSLLDVLARVLPLHLAPLTSRPLHELMIYDDVDTVKSRLVGAPRAAVHMALNNPHYYLQCPCCQLSSPGAITSSMPDICVAYKLHLECGKLINLYDWLQSFKAIVTTNQEKDDGEDREVCPELQARFARAVAELQFLGFIKSSKKTDHVTRLTFNPR